MTLSHRTILGLGTVAEVPFRAHATFANSEDHRMGISGAQSSGQRLQGLVPTTDISTCRIGDLASPTGRRTTRQNDGHRDPTSSAERHVRCARELQAPSALAGSGARRKPVFWAINPVRGRSLDSSPSFRVSDVRVADFDHACPGVDLIRIAVHVLKSRHRFRIHGRDHGVELQHAQLALAEIPESDDLDS